MHGGRFKSHVLLTSYEILMSSHDMPLLSSIPWHYLIVDEGHRLKNGACKLNACLRQYSTKHGILRTGERWHHTSHSAPSIGGLHIPGFWLEALSAA